MTRRELDVGVDLLWEQFHSVVNMTSDQLRDFLMADAAGADGTFPDEPDLGLDADGQKVLRVLAKRKVDLTTDDVDLMERVVEQVTNLLAAQGAAGLDDAMWRRDLMVLGHDPMRGSRFPRGTRLP
jgi:hypothetical protein